MSNKLIATEALFRREVLAERQSQWLGKVLLEPRLSDRIFSRVAVVLLVVVLAFLGLGSYTRKAHLNGWLIPDLGLVRVFSPQTGVVIKINVNDGQEVKRGTPLVVLSGELQSETLGSTRAEIVARLQSRRDSLNREKKVQIDLFDQQQIDLTRRLAAVQSQQEHIESEISLQRERLAVAQTAERRDKIMRARDLIPLPRYEQSEQERLTQSAALQALLRAQALLRNERSGAETALRQLPFKRQSQLGELDRNVATVEQELEEAEARRQIIVTAPQDGIVSAIQVETGGPANSTSPLLSIVPGGSKLEAHLFSPSRAIGFVQPGQKVMLRYQAFPYQKFGAYEGTIVSVSSSAISPSELPQHLSGLTSLYSANEPVFQVTVALDRQTASAYGKLVKLHPGMQLEADVMLDRRRLIEWIFDPLYALGRT